MTMAQDGLSPDDGAGDSTVGRSSAVAPESSSAEASRKKPRGRPPGSKNRPKPPVVITQESDSSMRPLVLHLSPGCDLVDAVAAFARRRRTGLSVLTGSGAVANVTLRHPTSLSATLTLHGRYDILSLAGTFLFSDPPPRASASSPSPAPSLQQFPLIVSLAGAQGQVIGGAVVGALLTAGPVVLVAAAFVSPAFHRIPVDDSEDYQITAVLEHDMEQGTPPPAGAGGHVAGADSSHNRSSSNMSVISAGHATVHNPIPLACQLSPDTLPAWAATSRPSAPYRSHG